jgi:hypothetical protein
MRVLLLLSFILILSHGAAKAEEISPQITPARTIQRIQGAYGYTLGDKFVTATALDKSTSPDGAFLYKVSPVSPYDKFDSYYVLITPVTQIIHTIWAQGKMVNSDVCKQEQKILMERLTEKYGSFDDERLTDFFGDAEEITQGERIVYTQCTDDSGNTLRVVYTDNKLVNRAIEEEKEIASQAQEEEIVDDLQITNKIVVVKTFEEPDPLTLFAPLGTTVVWVNHSRFPIEIEFLGKQVVQACGSPMNFFVGDSGSYASNKIPSGGTASLCFIEAGRYSYRTIPSKKLFMGKKGQEHQGTVWIK